MKAISLEMENFFGNDNINSHFLECLANLKDVELEKLHQLVRQNQSTKKYVNYVQIQELWLYDQPEIKEW